MFQSKSGTRDGAGFTGDSGTTNHIVVPGAVGNTQADASTDGPVSGSRRSSRITVAPSPFAVFDVCAREQGGPDGVVSLASPAMIFSVFDRIDRANHRLHAGSPDPFRRCVGACAVVLIATAHTHVVFVYVRTTSLLL